MWLLLAQAATPEAPSWLDSLGPFVPFGCLSLLVIFWLAKQLLKALSDKDAMAASTLPALTEATHALREATSIMQAMLERQGPAR